MVPFTEQGLMSSIASLKYTETIVPPPRKGPSIPPFDSYHFPRHGDAVLLVIPTANKQKTRILVEAFEKQKPPGTTIRQISIPAESDVGEQPYNERGAQGAHNRISNALHALADTTPEQQAMFEEEGIGTVIVASIENYIQEAGVPRPVDYGMVIVHNATTGRTVAAVTHGVTVPQAYLKHARSLGFEGDDESCGKVTVGQVLAANVPTLDKADWHVVVAGRSRYDLLSDAIDALQIPWQLLEQDSPPCH